MPQLPFPTRSSIALVAVGDPGRDRTVYATIVLLVAVGFAMILLAVWLLRTTRPDPEVLAPLERMGQRKWRRADPVWQRRHLDQVRPGGADPLEPSSAPPATDAEFERGPQPIGFDDLAVSDATSGAATVGLPAPSAAAVAVGAPVDLEHADEPTPGAGTAEVAADSVADDDVTGAPEDDSAVDAAAPATNAEGAVDDDDEDITGEQDTDDFLSVLERIDEPPSGIDTQADPDGDLDDDPMVEPEAEAVVEPEIEQDAEPDGDEVDEPDAEAVVEHDAEPDAEEVVEHDAEPDAEAVVEPVVPTASTSNDDERG